MEDLDNLKATELTLGLPGTDAPEKPSLASTTGATKRTNEECFSPAAKKQVVGWPPVRSYRMNSIRVRKMEAEDSTGIYVKVGMDGAPYLRKVDLRVYNSYKELMEALNYMFKCFSLVEVEIITGEDPGQVSFTRSPREVEARRFVTQWGKGYNPTEDATPKPENIETAGEGEGGGGHAMQQLQHHQRSTGGPNAAGPAPGPLRRRCEGTAMGAITLDLRPGFGIGPFNLGMPLHEAFAQVEHQPNLYDVVHVKYLDEEPLKLDIVISFPDHGFHLRFDPWSQRLRLIEVYDVKRLQMRYANSLIGGPSTLATFVAVYALFGPTYPGTYDQDRGIYTLFYPGLSFAFPIPSQYTYCCQNGEVSAELPLEFPDGTTPVACRVSVYDGSSDSKVGVGSLLDKASVPPLPAGSLYMEEVHAKDVWTELGRPCGIHQKQMKEHFNLEILGDGGRAAIQTQGYEEWLYSYCYSVPILSYNTILTKWDGERMRFRPLHSSVAAAYKPHPEARLLRRLNPISFMAADPPPPPLESEEDPDERLCAALDSCSFSDPPPLSPTEPIGRPLSGEIRVDRAWAHWNRLGAPKLVVAPMVDNSELPFRMLCRKYGAEAAYTPMLHSRIFSENEKYRSMEFTTCKEDRPLFVQFCANDPDVLLESAKMVEPYCDYVDINLGCPQRIARRGNYGAFLMDNLPLIKSLVQKLSQTLQVPVSCKIRIFPNLQDTIAYARMLEEAGCALLAVHGRTRDEKDGKKFRADWNAIKAVKDAIGIPVLANGNIRHMGDVYDCLDHTGADGVLSAESLLENPALFAGFRTREPKENNADEIKDNGGLDQGDLVVEYLKFCEQYPVPWRMVRSHVHKMLGDWFRIHPQVREELNAQSKLTFEWLRDMVKRLKQLGGGIPLYTQANTAARGNS
ncbi:Dihydrouridine synthase (Dus) [Musa troglodytarum]|uniref:Auxin-responsive protein n=1 Tax=Musa troglodytarum TaxID=320322 RepID=A0A9E7H3G2_9LILI|nr:Dihydrouridine synthase (Dus) [Musa troglodytarum]